MFDSIGDYYCVEYNHFDNLDYRRIFLIIRVVKTAYPPGKEYKYVVISE
jgi:hypothetical protein